MTDIAAIRALFPALDRWGDGHTPECSTIRFSGSIGPDPHPPDPCTCAGPAVLALLADTPSVEPLDEALAILDVIDGIVDDTHPEGDGCPLCAALDELRDILGGTTR